MTLLRTLKSSLSRGLVAPWAGGYPWEPGSTGGRIDLLQPAQGTYTRTGEASYMTGDATMAWLAADTGPPIETSYGTTGYFFHRGRTNSCLRSEELGNAVWTATGVTVNADADQPPDYPTEASADADELQFTASATADIAQSIAGTANSQTVNLSVWVRCASGTQAVRLAWTDRSGSTTNGVDLTVTTTWTLVERKTVGTGSGASSPVFRIRNASDGAARNVFVWGAQVIIDAGATGGDYPKQYIRTTSAATTSGHAALLFPSASVPARIYSGSWAIDFMPDFSSSEVGASNTHHIYRFAISADRLVVTAGGRIQLTIGGVLVADTNPSNPTWSRGQKLTVKVDFGPRLMTVSGATTNNGSVPITGVAVFATQDLNLGFAASGHSGKLSMPYVA